MKILHLTFHGGCANAIKSMFMLFNVELETKIVTSGKDGYYYNMTQERADKAWETHKDYYNSFDTIIVTDTVPLSRIFLGNYNEQLIIIATNRFDYYDSREKGFPDAGYYELLRWIPKEPNVFFYANNYFDEWYAEQSGIVVDGVIKLAGYPHKNLDRYGYYVPMYSNDIEFKLANRCVENGLFVSTGRYRDSEMLSWFKAVVHLPYTWSSIALFDGLSAGTPYYVPTKEFLLELLKERTYWFQNSNFCEKHLHLCEFYSKENSVFIKYFSNFEDIKEIEPDYEKINQFANQEYEKYRDKWIDILNI